MKKWLCLVVCLLIVAAMPMTVFAVPETELELIDVVLEPEKRDDGSIVVWINDARGHEIPGWIIYLEIDGESVKSYDVDGDSKIVIDYEFPAEQTTVECRSYEGECAGVVFYREAIVDLTKLVYGETAETATTTTISEETTTEPVTETTAPQSTTDGLSFAPFTTATGDNGRVAIGVDVDNALVNASQLVAEDFVMDSRLWLPASQFASLVSTADGTLHLELTLNSEAGSKTKLIAAKNADASYAEFADSEVQGFAMNMKLMYVDDDIRQQLDVADGEYELELKLPEALKDCRKIAVAVCTVDGLDTFYEVTPSDGMIRIGFGRFQTIALVGFGRNAASEMNILVVIIVAGAVLILGGAAVLLFVTFRRKKQEHESPEEEEEKVVLRPVAEEDFDDEEAEEAIIAEETIQEILMNYDEQTELTDSEREQYRAKATNDQKSFETIVNKSVPAAKQLTDSQLESIRRSAEKQASKAPITVDDLLDELTRDIDDLIND